MDLKFTEKLPDPKDPEFQSRFNLVLRLEQIDEVLEYKKDPNTTPEMQKRIAEFLDKYDRTSGYPHDHPESVKHIEFVHWMKCNGCNLRKTRLALYGKDFRGIHATVDIAKGEDIFTIPMTLSVNGAEIDETELGKKLAKLVGERWKIYLFPLIYVLEEMRNRDSKCRRWLDLLPTAATFDHPGLLSPEERVWLQGSDINTQLEIGKGTLHAPYECIGQIEPDFCRRHSFTEFMQMCYILTSRFFTLPSYNPNWVYMMPYADMANTGMQSQKNAAWNYDKSRNCFRFVAQAPIKAGEPITPYYGHASNFTLMLYYGITVDDLEHDSVSFVLDFTKVPHSQIKAALLQQSMTCTKRASFYAFFAQRKNNNLRFMADWRYYLYSGETAKLANYVNPAVKSLDNLPDEKRKVAFAPETVAYEHLVLSTLSERARERLKLYPTKLEEDEALLKQKGLSYKRMCAAQLISGEKRSLLALLDMVDYALGLLKLGSIEKAKKEYEALPKKPVYAPYIEENLFKLTDWK